MGGDGKDIIYGSNRADALIGDNNDLTNSGGRGDDDIIYSGFNDLGMVGIEYIHGGRGDDKIYGQGLAPIAAYGEYGDDLIHGVDFEALGDFLVGDGDALFGDDTIYGHKGDDVIGGNAGDDFLDGGEGDDLIEGD